VTVLRRLSGAILAGLVAVPVYRLLYGREVGVIGADVLLVTEQDRALMLIGAPIALALGLVFARLAGEDGFERASRRIGRTLASIPGHRFALLLGAIATAYAAVFSLRVLDGSPNLIDAMTQLLHARFVAAGDLAGPVDRWLPFWIVQNSVVTDHGWVSQYPPGHVLLLAFGFLVGAVWAVGPILSGITVSLTALTADRLLPDDLPVARTGALLAASSPFFIAHAGAYMNHVSAAAMGAAAIYCSVRARDEQSLVWTLLAGAGIGAALTIRPLAAVATALTAAAIFAISYRREAAPPARWARTAFAAALGALPFVAALAAYNARFFGDPFRFGYTAAQGPAMGLGFHRDPWGNMYGLVEAVGFTSADLTALSLHLLGSPIPVVLVVGLFILSARRLTPGQQVLALWALIPVATGALYWHHGMFMGPRMLNEAAPAWALLAAVSAIGLVQLIPPSWEARGYSARAALGIAFAVAAVTGVLYLGPERLLQYGGAWQRSLVFVHGGWTGRIAARLSAHGLRLDSLEAALRRNSTCDVQRFADEYTKQPRTGSVTQPLDFTLRAGNLPRIYVSRGNWILQDNRTLPPDCRRQVAADTLGTVDVAPLAWKGDLPGAPRSGTMIVRDLGPEANAALIAAHPDRVPMMFMRRSDEEAPVLLPYGAGASTLWPGLPR
jgi:hypothetical protein